MTSPRKVFVPDPFDPGVAAFAEEQRRANRDWIAEGPGWTYRPAACWTCFTTRLYRNGWTARGRPRDTRTVPAPGCLRDGRVAPLPGCPRCGPLPALQGPEEWVHPLTGIIRRVTVVEAWPGFWIAAAEASQTRYLALDGRWWAGRPLVSSGHGFTRDEARRKALFEAAERHALLWAPYEEALLAPWTAVRDRAIHPARLLLYSRRQYRERAAANEGAFPRVPEPFDEHVPIAWVAVRGGRRAAPERLVPAETCFLGLGGRFAFANSNGCAAGPDPEAAARAARRELIERDAVALWWYNRARRPPVRFDHPARRLMERARRSFWVLDLTHDLGVPVAVAVSASAAGGRPVVGAGAADTLAEAAAKAAGEMLLGYHGLREQARAGVPAAEGLARDAWHWHRTARLAAHPYLRPAPRACRLPARPDAEAAVPLWCKGFRTSDLGISVVRAFSPGLRPWWPRFAPGRLYDVPPAIGWTARRLREDELNPVPFSW